VIQIIKCLIARDLYNPF